MHLVFAVDHSDPLFLSLATSAVPPPRTPTSRQAGNCKELSLEFELRVS